MKVSELITALRNANRDATVILSRDAEGNDFKPLCEVDLSCVYDNGNKEVWDTQDEDYESDDADVPCVVLWPVD